jgi:hypothetical protein
MSEMIGNTARDAVVGGTISVIGGGKFKIKSRKSEGFLGCSI